MFRLDVVLLYLFFQKIEIRYFINTKAYKFSLEPLQFVFFFIAENTIQISADRQELKTIPEKNYNNYTLLNNLIYLCKK